MTETTDQIEECHVVVNFPNRSDITLAFATDIGNSGMPGIGLSFMGPNGPEANGYITDPATLSRIIPVLSHMLAKAHAILEDGSFKTLAEALQAKQITANPANVVPLFGKKPK